MPRVSTIAHVLKTPGNEHPFHYGRAFCGEPWTMPFLADGRWAPPGTIFGAFMMGYSRLCERCVQGAQKAGVKVQGVK